MVPHKWPLTCPTGILSPRGEEEVTFIACEGLLLTFPSPFGERVSEGRVRGYRL